MRLRLEPRIAPSVCLRYGSPVIALALTMVLGAILFAALGRDPLEALYTFFVRPVSTLYGLSELAIKAAPLLLCAVGLAVGFRGNVWNIGAEGQLTMGAIFGGGVALAFYGNEGPWLLPLMIVAGGIGGMLYGAIPAFLKVRFNANEILTSLMLTYVAIQVLGYLVHGPWRDPEGYNFPETRLFGDDALLPILIEGTRLHGGVVLALFATVGCWILISRTFAGFQLRVVGQAIEAANYAGFSRNRVIWISFLVSGGLAGWAGLGEVAGPMGQLNPTISPGYGFAAIIVAFLGRLHPLGVLLASLLMALMYLGGESLQMNLNLPLAITGVFQGLLLFLVLASDVFIRYRLIWRSELRSPAA
ncbi:MAG: ABC transporter permease [Alphaproteobacteria bacterium]|nr:ABC transporter permease [Alphaproteobacteria bacterium]